MQNFIFILKKKRSIQKFLLFIICQIILYKNLNNLIKITAKFQNWDAWFG